MESENGALRGIQKASWAATIDFIESKQATKLTTDLEAFSMSTRGKDMLAIVLGLTSHCAK